MPAACTHASLPSHTSSQLCPPWLVFSICLSYLTFYLFFVFVFVYTLVSLHTVHIPLCLFGIKSLPKHSTVHTLVSLYTLQTLSLDEAVSSPLFLHLHFAHITLHIALIMCIVFAFVSCVCVGILYLYFVFIFCSYILCFYFVFLFFICILNTPPHTLPW